MSRASCPQSNKGVLVRASREVSVYDVSCLMSPALCLMSHALCLMPHASRPQSSKGVLVRASREVSVYSVNKEQKSTDAYISLMSDV